MKAGTKQKLGLAGGLVITSALVGGLLFWQSRDETTPEVADNANVNGFVVCEEEPLNFVAGNLQVVEQEVRAQVAANIDLIAQSDTLNESASCLALLLEYYRFNQFVGDYQSLLNNYRNTFTTLDALDPRVAPFVLEPDGYADFVASSQDIFVNPTNPIFEEGLGPRVPNE